MYFYRQGKVSLFKKNCSSVSRSRKDVVIYSVCEQAFKLVHETKIKSLHPKGSLRHFALRFMHCF